MKKIFKSSLSILLVAVLLIPLFTFSSFASYYDVVKVSSGYITAYKTADGLELKQYATTYEGRMYQIKSQKNNYIVTETEVRKDPNNQKIVGKMKCPDEKVHEISNAKLKNDCAKKVKIKNYKVKAGTFKRQVYADFYYKRFYSVDDAGNKCYGSLDIQFYYYSYGVTRKNLRKTTKYFSKSLVK